MKNLSIVGIGKLGLCFALTIEKSGYNVLGCDINKNYVDSLNNRVFSSDEKGVNKVKISQQLQIWKIQLISQM